MTMTDTQELTRWRGRDVVDESGEKIGRLEEIYVDDETGRPEWLAVKTSWFGGHVSLVPLQDASASGDMVRVPFSKEKVKGAPHFDVDGHLEASEEDALYEYYGRSWDATAGYAADAQYATGTGNGQDTSGPNTDDAMTRSEEELRVGKTTREAGRARLRKWVEVEHETANVAVAHDEVRVVREPITDGNIDKAMDGPEISSEEHEVVLREEQAVAETEVVPKERVRMEKETVTETETVGADLRKERIEAEGTTGTDERL